MVTEILIRWVYPLKRIDQKIFQILTVVVAW